MRVQILLGSSDLVIGNELVVVGKNGEKIKFEDLSNKAERIIINL